VVLKKQGIGEVILCDVICIMLRN